MTYPSRATTVTGDAASLLPGQFVDSTDLKAWLATFTDAVQAIEDAAWSILTLRPLAVAQGIQLDEIGQHVGLSRQGLADAFYRAALYLQIAINCSHGAHETLISITRTITRASLVHYMTKHPKVAYLYSHEIRDWSLLPKTQRAAPAGTRVVQTGSEDANVFVLGADHDSSGVQCGDDLPYGSGFGETSS